MSALDEIGTGNVLPLSGMALTELVSAMAKNGASVRFRAGGYSMAPFIRDGDVVTISPFRGRKPTLGDVVAFSHPQKGSLCVHRVVSRKFALYVTKGDNKCRDGEVVQEQSILGFVTRVERDGKDIFLGLGRERYLVAFLSHHGLLFPLSFPIWRVIRRFVRGRES